VKERDVTDRILDLAVIGAGPCGLAVGVAARQAEMTAAIFDRGNVTNGLLGYPIGMTFFSTPENLEIGGLPFICAAAKPTREEALKYYRRIAQHFDLDIRAYEEVVGVTGERGAFSLTTRRRSGAGAAHRARCVVVATGYFDTPNLLDVPGEDLPNVTHYFREPHPYFDQRCIVVGGGNSAAEAALDLFRAGAHVMLVHFLAELDPGIKPWVRPDIENRIRDGSIAARFETRLSEIGPDYVRLRSEKNGAEERLANDWVFAMTGYTPDTSFLRRLGVAVDKATAVPRHDPSSLETNVPGIYIAGVIAAGKDANRLFIENGRFHGEKIVASLR
jgi:thioredoxin reductase (NADPH)